MRRHAIDGQDDVTVLQTQTRRGPVAGLGDQDDIPGRKRVKPISSASEGLSVATVAPLSGLWPLITRLSPVPPGSGAVLTWTVLGSAALSRAQRVRLTSSPLRRVTT